MFKLATKAAEGGRRRRLLLRDQKKRTEPTSTSIAKHPKTMAAIAGPDNLTSSGGLDGRVVWTLALVGEGLVSSIDLGNISRLATISGRRSYCELSRYFTTRTKSNSKRLFSNISTCTVC